MKSLVLVVIGMVLSLASFAPGADDTKSRRNDKDNSPAVGDKAPDFNLVTLEGFLKDGDKSTNMVTLSSFQGKEPVVFVLSSYT